MRKTLAIYQASPRRLLTLLLITYLVGVAVGAPYSGRSNAIRDSNGLSRSRGHSSNFQEKCVRLNDNRPVSREQFRRAKQKVNRCKGLAFTKTYQFVSQSSKRFLQIRPTTRREVAARGRTIHGQYTWLNMTSYNCPGSNSRHIVRIKGVKRKNSLCFTPRGALVQKEDRRLSVRCAFYERAIKEPGYESQTVLVSAFNPNFIVAFDDSGKRLRGGKYSGRCNYISKLEEQEETREDWHSLQPISQEVYQAPQGREQHRERHEAAERSQPQRPNFSVEAPRSSEGSDSMEPLRESPRGSSSEARRKSQRRNSGERPRAKGTERRRRRHRNRRGRNKGVNSRERYRLIRHQRQKNRRRQKNNSRGR